MRLAVSGEPTEETLTFERQIRATEAVDGPGPAVDRGQSGHQDLPLLRYRVQYVCLRHAVQVTPS